LYPESVAKQKSNRPGYSIHNHKPWLRSTGPKTPEGKAKTSRNGKARQTGRYSRREIDALLRGAKQKLDAATETIEKLSSSSVDQEEAASESNIADPELAHRSPCRKA
jgi:hypothetical protein